MANPDRYEDADFRRATGVTEQEIQEVLSLVRGSGLLELEVAWGKTRLVLKRQASSETAPHVPELSEEVRAAVEHAEERTAITSPVVGLFHPAIQEGDEVQHNQPLGTVEAMGMTSSVDAPQGGVVEELLVTDGEPVEYGQVLVVLRRA